MLNAPVGINGLITIRHILVVCNCMLAQLKGGSEDEYIHTSELSERNFYYRSHMGSFSGKKFPSNFLKSKCYKSKNIFNFKNPRLKTVDIALKNMPKNFHRHRSTGNLIKFGQLSVGRREKLAIKPYHPNKI